MSRRRAILRRILLALTWLLVAIGPQIRAAAAAEATTEPEPRASLATSTLAEDWAAAGFRLELGATYGGLMGLSGAPSGSGFGVVLRVGARLDRDWSLLASVRYASVIGDTGVGLLGLRYMAMVEPVWHLTPTLELALGVGAAGIVEGGTGRAEVDGPGRDALVAPVTLPNASPPLPTCAGIGAAASLRASWRWRIGPLASTGLDLVADGQRTLCVDDTGRVEPDSATAIVRRQWWPHLGAALMWVVAWR